MEFLRVKNWETFQHYKDRSPPWIKLHRDLLRDYDFLCLQDASKLHLMLIWLLASQMDNRIPADENFIRNQIGVKSKIDFNELIDKGFLIDDSNTLATRKQVAIIETETEAYREETEKDYFDDFWNNFPNQRKGSKDKAKSSWKAATLRADPKTILEGVSMYAKSTEVANGFAKGAAAWLNDDRWTTDYTVKTKHKGYNPNDSIAIALADQTHSDIRISGSDDWSPPYALPKPTG